MMGFDKMDFGSIGAGMLAAGLAVALGFGPPVVLIVSALFLLGIDLIQVMRS